MESSDRIIIIITSVVIIIIITSVIIIITIIIIIIVIIVGTALTFYSNFDCTTTATAHGRARGGVFQSSTCFSKPST